MKKRKSSNLSVPYQKRETLIVSASLDEVGPKEPVEHLTCSVPSGEAARPFLLSPRGVRTDFARQTFVSTSEAPQHDKLSQKIMVT